MQITCLKKIPKNLVENEQINTTELDRITNILEEIDNGLVNRFNSEEYKKFTSKLLLYTNNNQYDIIYNISSSIIIHEFNKRYKPNIEHQSIKWIALPELSNNKIIYDIKLNYSFDPEIYDTHEQEITRNLELLITKSRNMIKNVIQEEIMKPDFQKEQQEINRIRKITQDVLDKLINDFNLEQYKELIRKILLYAKNYEHHMIKDKFKSIAIHEFNKKYKPDITRKCPKLSYTHKISNNNRIIYILHFNDNLGNQSIYDINHKDEITNNLTLLKNQVDNLIKTIIEQEIIKENFQKRKQEINRIRAILQDLWNQFIDYFNSQEYKESTEKLLLNKSNNQQKLASNLINEFNNKYRLKIGHQYPTYSLSEQMESTLMLNNKKIIYYLINSNNNFTSQSIYDINYEEQIRSTLQFLVLYIYKII